MQQQKKLVKVIGIGPLTVPTSGLSYPFVIDAEAGIDPIVKGVLAESAERNVRLSLKDSRSVYRVNNAAMSTLCQNYLIPISGRKGSWTAELSNPTAGPLTVSFAVVVEYPGLE